MIVQSISLDLLDLFEAYSGPGNIRELQSVNREALIASTGHTLLTEFVPAAIRREPLEEESRPPAANLPAMT
jgi:DNA-binding NtrC family response regulator